MKRKKLLLALLCGCTSIMTLGCGSAGASAPAAPTPTEDETESIVTGVVVNTEVTPGGQFPLTLVATLDKEIDISVNAEDFSMEGQATNWMDPKLHAFTATFKDAAIEGDKLTLTFDRFDDKYFFVENWNVTNKTTPSLSFDSGKITQVVTPVADEFTFHSKADGEAFDYQLFEPENAQEPLPIVVVFHGFADTHNLGAYRTSIAWAEPEAQAKRPCYVLSPVIDDNTYFNEAARGKVFPHVHDKVVELIEAGKVDPNRVYIMGNSFGGMSTIEFNEMYPDFAAGSLALCAALNYSKSAMGGLDSLTNLPIWICAAENDNTIPSQHSKDLYAKLVELGSEVANLRIYTDDEMNAAGGSSDPNSTFSYHHVEMAVMEDEFYAQWLFEQTK